MSFEIFLIVGALVAAATLGKLPEILLTLAYVGVLTFISCGLLALGLLILR